MAVLVADRVKEFTLTTGTGTYALGGPSVGFRAFLSVFNVGDVVYYCCENGTDWEVGQGTLSPGQLARTGIISSSNGGLAINWAAGTKNIFCSFPAIALNNVNNAATLNGIETLANKTIDLTNNTLTGTKAQFDAACSDDNFAYQTDIALKENLANKATSFATVNNTLYPTTQAVVNYILPLIPSSYFVTTADATPTVITLDGLVPSASNVFILSPNFAYTIISYITARNTTTGDMASWKVEGSIKQGATAATTALVGTPVITTIAKDTAASAWAVNMIADIALGAAEIQVTGVAATSIKWECNLSFVKAG